MNETVEMSLLNCYLRSKEDSGHYCQVFDSNYMEAAAEWPGKLVDPEGLKVYMPEEDVEREGVFEGQINTFKADTLEELAEQTREGAPVLTEIKVEPADEGFVRLIKELEGVYSVGREGSRLIVGSDRDVGNALAQAALDCGLKLVSLRPCGNDLDDIYQRYFEKAGHEDGNRDGSKIKRFISRNR